MDALTPDLELRLCTNWPNAIVALRDVQCRAARPWTPAHYRIVALSRQPSILKTNVVCVL